MPSCPTSWRDFYRPALLALIAHLVDCGNRVAIAFAGLDALVAETRRLNQVGDALKRTSVDGSVHTVASKVSLGIAIPGELDGVDAGRRGETGWNRWRENVLRKNRRGRGDLALGHSTHTWPAHTLDRVFVVLVVFRFVVDILHAVALGDLSGRCFLLGPPEDAEMGLARRRPGQFHAFEYEVRLRLGRSRERRDNSQSHTIRPFRSVAPRVDEPHAHQLVLAGKTVDRDLCCDRSRLGLVDRNLLFSHQHLRGSEALHGDAGA